MSPSDGWAIARRAVEATPDRTDEQPPPARPSSWSAALSQLPGFPREEKPTPVEPSQPARTVSPMKAGDES